MPRSANDGIDWTGADSSGRAALLLAESLIHALVAKDVLGVDEAVELIEVAADVESELAGVAHHAPPHPINATLLGPLAATLRADLADGHSPPLA